MATAVDKLRCAERELRLRLRVYPDRIVRGLMREDDARREIATMEEIAADYRAIVEREPPGPLFACPAPSSPPTPTPSPPPTPAPTSPPPPAPSSAPSPAPTSSPSPTPTPRNRR